LNETMNPCGAHSNTSGLSIFGTSCSGMFGGPSEDWILCSTYKSNQHHITLGSHHQLYYAQSSTANTRQRIYEHTMQKETEVRHRHTSMTQQQFLKYIKIHKIIK